MIAVSRWKPYALLNTLICSSLLKDVNRGMYPRPFKKTNNKMTSISKIGMVIVVLLSAINSFAQSEQADAGNGMNPVFEGYFAIKDALVENDATAASAAATGWLAAVGAVDMEALPAEVHAVWTDVMGDLSAHAESISVSADVAKQREAFAKLAEPIHGLAKVAEHGAPVYYQHCPMYGGKGGASWLSKEEAVKNPYYGAQMLTCGRTVETMK